MLLHIVRLCRHWPEGIPRNLSGAEDVVPVKKDVHQAGRLHIVGIFDRWRAYRTIDMTVDGEDLSAGVAK